MLLFLEKVFTKINGLPDTLSKEFPFECLSVVIYEQFIVSIVELIMLSWQPILLYNFHNIRVTRTVAHKGQCNRKWFAANKKDRMQTKKIGCKQKDRMHRKNQNLSRCKL